MKQFCGLKLCWQKRVSRPNFNCVCGGGGLPTPTSNSWTPSRVSKNSSHFWPCLPGTESDSTRKGFSPTGPSSIPPGASHTSRSLTCASDQLAANQRFPWLAPQLQWICQDSSQIPGKPIYLLDFQFIHRVWDIGHGLVEGGRASMPSPGTWVPLIVTGVLQPGNSLNPGLWIFSEASLQRHD